MTWLQRLVHRDRLDDQLDAELRDHFERLVADLRAKGYDDAAARRLARLECGGLDQAKEACRDARGTRWLEDTIQDVRYAVRGCRKAPAFTAVAVTTLAIGIGANLTVFSVFDALLLRPLPVPNASRLVTFTRWIQNNSSESFSYPQIRGLGERTDLFESVAGVSTDTMFVGPPESLEPVGTSLVSGDYFETLGLTPLAGRLLGPADDRPGVPVVAVISHRYWMQRFNGAADTVGRTIRLEGQQVPVVGITPPGFIGATIGEPADITVAVHANRVLRPEDGGDTTADSRWLLALAVPARSLTREQLQAGLDVAWRRVLEATTPGRVTGEARTRALSMTLTVERGINGASRLRAPMRRPISVALALVTLVLLIACVNVANLLLARGASRGRELAMRLALGAGRGRILRQLLVESALLAIAGTGIGVWIAWFGSGAVSDVMGARMQVPDTAMGLEVAPNWRVCATTALVAGVTTVIFGLVPAWRASGTPHGTLANTGRIVESHGRLASSLIVAQVSLSLLLVIGAGLFMRSLHNLRTLDRGFAPGNVLLASVNPERAGLTPAQLLDFNRSVLRRVEALPGVGAVSLGAITPLQGGGMSQPMVVNGVSTGLSEIHFNLVAPRYFEILGTPLLAGRDFTAGDDAAAPAAAIVNETFVRRHLQPGNPLGQRVAMSGFFAKGEMGIVGVVKDAVYESMRAAPPPTLYVPYLQTRGRPMHLVIDARAPLHDVAATVRAAVQPMVPATPMRIRSFAAQIESSLFQARLMMSLTTIFGVLALVLAVVGLYGLMSYTVAGRTREIGVRLALGARPARVQRMVLAQALRMVVIGIAIGLPIAWLSSRLVRSLLFGLEPTDGLTITASVVILLTAGIAAAALPARRAATLNPVAAIHYE
jgi:predicted permease